MPAGEVGSARLPVQIRIMIALDQLRTARDQGELERELVWQTRLDELLDQYSQQRASA